MKNNRKKGELTSQESFVLKHKKQHRKIQCLRGIIFFLFLFIWEICSSCNIIDSFFFSSPSMVMSCLISMLADGTLFSHTFITLAETLISFSLVILIGLFFATLLWYYPSLSKIMDPYLVVLNSLPKSALAPLFIVWLGTGMKTIIVAGISVAVFGCIISLYTSFSEVDPEQMKLIYTLGGKKKDILLKVVYPSSIPTILSTMKVNIGLSLVGVVIGEFLAARKGLGYLIIYGSQVFQLNLVITSIVILCVIAMLLYKGINLLEKHSKS